MSSLKVLRHEYKYQINRTKMYDIRDKLGKILDIDRNYDGYMVRSLYFDALEDDDYYQKLSGDIDRKKIRIRIYNPDSDFMKLELKGKHDYHQLKESLIINKKTALELIKGNYGALLEYDDDIAKKIYLIMRQRCYKPKCIIEYNRIAFVSHNNTRITIDSDIKVSRHIDNQLFSKKINYLDITDPNQVVLEVKFDNFLEDYVGRTLDQYISNSSSISKYVMGRNKEV